MRVRSYGRGLLCGLFLILMTIPMTGLAQDNGAQEGSGRSIVPVLGFGQRDLDGDGQPDAATIATSFTSGQDSVMVFDTANDMQWSEDWQTGTDFSNDVWIFILARTSMPPLIVRFTIEDGLYVAELFDDVDDDGQVTYQPETSGQVTITEATFPTARVTARQPWILPDGRVNYAVDVAVYRAPVQDTIGGMELYPVTGSPISESELVDLDDDGFIDYELQRVYPGVPLDWGATRAGLNINIDDDEVFDFQQALFWPYLGALKPQYWDGGSILRSPGEHHPPILIDVDTANLYNTSFMPLWGGRRLRYNSTSPIFKDQANLMRFERFGHYSFAGTDSPDLAIRWDLHPPVYTSAEQDLEQTPHMMQAEINWHGVGDAGTINWDYKLELAGVHLPPSNQIQLRDFSVYDVSYDDWPTWFTDQDWAFATFVAVEGGPYLTNETIYEWNSVEGALIDIRRSLDARGARGGEQAYLRGETSQSPGQYYQQIREGLRGEYADLMNTRADLYFSPVDHRLHLYGASHGVWNMGDKREIRYSNLGGDYINRWTLRYDGQSRRDLIVADEYVVVSDEQGIALTAVSVEPSLFTTLPPSNRNEWLALDAQLTDNAPTVAPDDFRAMAGQFSGPRFSLSGARMIDFRLTDDGFRFLAIVKPDNSWGSDLPVTGLSGRLAAGTYLVEMRDGRLSFSRATAPQPALGEVTFETGDITALHPLQVSTTLTNNGLRDAHGVTVRFYAEQNGTRSLIDEVQTDVPSGLETPVTILWEPPGPGEWHVSAEASPYPMKTSTTVEVQVATDANQRLFMSLNEQQPMGGLFVVTLAAALGLTAATLFLLITRSGLREV